MADTDSTLEVHKAFVAALRGDTAVAALVGARVYDRMPQASQFPAISLGPIYGQPAVETVGGEGFELLVTLDIWSRSQAGRVEASRIMAAIIARLNNAELTLDTKSVVLCRLSDQFTVQDQDGVTHHGIQRWRVVTDG